MSFSIGPRDYTDPDVVRMVADVQQEYVGMYGGPDSDPLVAAEFAAPDGLLLVGTSDGAAVAMGGWRRLGPGLAEIKRMYVAPAARGQGLARELLAELERTAAAAGITRLTLSTGPPQRPAIALYTSCGYTPGERFGHYAAVPGAIFLAKSLPAGR